MILIYTYSDVDEFMKNKHDSRRKFARIDNTMMVGVCKPKTVGCNDIRGKLLRNCSPRDLPGGEQAKYEAREKQ